MNKIFVGLDVSKNDYKCCILDGEGNRIGKVFALKNNACDASVLAENLAMVCQGNAIDKIFIGYESTSVYGWHLQ